MKKITIIIIVCCLFYSSKAQLERRFQIWNKNEIDIQPWQNVTIEVAEKIHYSPNHNDIDLKYAEIFLSHEPAKWFEYGAGFRVSYLNKYPGWLQENRPMLFANFSELYKKFFFQYSNRLEYRVFEIDFNHFRYRQAFLVEFPSLANWGMQFYLSEEAFFMLNGNGFHLARIYGGLQVLQTEHYEVKVFYALEKLKLNEWKTTDIVGLNLTFII